MSIVEQEFSISRTYTTFGFSVNDLDDLLDQFSLPLRNHSRRVAVCSSIMADCINEYTYPYRASIDTGLAVVAHLGGTCHDIGKLLLPTLMITEAEYKQHPLIGMKFLEEYKRLLFNSEAQTQMVLDVVCYHHEQPDGGGFPEGTKRKDIPIVAGICALADWLDHHLYTKQESCAYICDIFNDVKMKAGNIFYESAVMCFECAWPQIKERYAKWNRFAT